jgi:hypothetical protein
MADMMNWVVCGRLIGQVDRRDYADTFSIQLYNLQPHPAYKGPIGECLSINFETGMIEAYDKNDKFVASSDLIDAVKDCPVDRID